MHPHQPEQARAAGGTDRVDPPREGRGSRLGRVGWRIGYRATRGERDGVGEAVEATLGPGGQRHNAVPVRSSGNGFHCQRRRPLARGAGRHPLGWRRDEERGE
jgi:hypothetical protein